MNEPNETIKCRGFTVEIYPDETPDNPREWGNAGTMVLFGEYDHLGDTMSYKREKEKRTIRPLYHSQSDFLTSNDAKDAAIIYALEVCDRGSYGITASLGGDITEEVLAVLVKRRMGFVERDSDGEELDEDTQNENDFDGLLEADGFLFITKKKAREEFGDDLEKAPRHLLSELKIYNQWLNGEVYGFQLRDKSGEVVDSCWGFYGYDWKENGMYDYIKPTVNHIFQERRTKKAA